jgi:nucleotide-binding universal stress UspA family protein
MSEGVAVVVIMAAAWLVIGLALAVVMGRRGHSGFGWLVLGTVLGPLSLVLAVDATRRGESSYGAEQEAPGTRVGPVDVLVGYDGSPESAAALATAARLFADRTGRFTVATVVPFGDLPDVERRAEQALAQAVAGQAGAEPLLLRGHPATALAQFAVGSGFDVVAIGTRGTGISKAILGSAASELARNCKVPVLLVSGRPGP